LAKKARVYDGTQWVEIAASQVDLLNSAVYKMNSGTTAERPAGSAGLFRFNSTTGYPEWYDITTSAWYNFYQTKPIEYLVIAGGGGGGHGLSGVFEAGGGGAGGYLTGYLSIVPGTSYTVTIGNGGSSGVNGSNSVFSSLTAIGGGRGGGQAGGPAVGGSGGGGHNTSGAAGTAGQGNAGGNSGAHGASGGGGAGASGSNSASPGGIGLQSSITGTATYYAGGGGGARGGALSAAGGLGGGGASGGPGANGTANTGGGGGGGISAGSRVGGTGGSGVVILSYPSAHTITIGAGLTGTTATVGSNKVTTFTAGTGSVIFS
jgi:hypothetical protein